LASASLYCLLFITQATAQFSKIPKPILLSWIPFPTHHLLFHFYFSFISIKLLERVVHCDHFLFLTIVLIVVWLSLLDCNSNVNKRVYSDFRIAQPNEHAMCDVIVHMYQVYNVEETTFPATWSPGKEELISKNNKDILTVWKQHKVWWNCRESP
jgi:hypothetical protein